jgi:paraquat-inducible protein A
MLHGWRFLRNGDGRDSHAAGAAREQPMNSGAQHNAAWQSAALSAITACNACGLVQRAVHLRAGAVAVCCRCGAIVSRCRAGGLARTQALTLAALILYVPANIYPILRITYYGAYSESTVWDGCVNLFREGQWPVALIVFLASILIPLFKLLGLLYVTVLTRVTNTRSRRQRTWVHRIIERIGPWAMLDVFITAILVGLVKLGQFVTVLPGRGLLPFTAVVVLTILASASFDPKLLWDQPDATS